MAAAERRRAILDVVIPLLIEKGAALTTAQIAHAANIAEGTIFRVFPDKRAVIFEAVKAAMDPSPVVQEIEAISRSASMRTQLTEAAQVLLSHFRRMMALGESLRSMSALHAENPKDAKRLVKKSAAGISEALAELFERHHGALRVSPRQAAAAFRGLILASGHPLLPPGERLGVDDAVTILLSGIAKT